MIKGECYASQVNDFFEQSAWYSKSGGVKGLSNELMQLRKICQHPFLFDSVEDRINPAGIVDDKLIRCSGKLELLSRILPKFFTTGHRVCRMTLSSKTCSQGISQILGPDFLPDDQSDGYNGGFP
jgi:hypothetical protein